MDNIYIKAYINKNLGDDLFLKILLERYPRNIFYLIEECNLKLEKMYTFKNLKIVNYSILIKIFNYLLRKLNISINFTEENLIKKKNIKAIIEIGGSIFMENKSNISLKIRKKDQEQVKNYFILGANFGPYSSDKFLKEYYSFFSKCNDICFRERYSYDLFKNLSNIRYAKDIIFSLNVNNYSEKEYMLISVIKPSIRRELREKDKEYYKTVKNIIIESLKNNKKVKLISFCKNEGDEEAIEEILRIIPESFRDRVDKYYYRGNIEEALEIIGKAEAIVATRFHAMILGFIYKKKVYPIAYSKKTTNVLEDLEFKGNYCSFDKLNEVSYDKIMENEILDEDILELAKKDAEKHFEKLDLFLKEEK